MQRQVRKYLHDIQTACAAILEFIEGRSFEDYCANEMLRSAVERKLAIVGEALGKALDIEPGLAEEIPDVRAIINLRNIIIHAYSAVEERTIWGIVQSNVPVGQQTVLRLMNS